MVMSEGAPPAARRAEIGLSRHGFRGGSEEPAGTRWAAMPSPQRAAASHRASSRRSSACMSVMLLGGIDRVSTAW